jgi:hypothetical protein
MTGLWYLACPYSHTEQSVMVQRFDQVNEFAAKLMRAGLMVFSPISHTHPIVQYGLPEGWDFWEQYDRCIIGHCKGLIVCQFDGWDASVGVQAEIGIAGDLGRDVYYVRPQDEADADRFLEIVHMDLTV